MSNKVETFELGADVARLNDLVKDVLYQNKDIFLRELISNSSDAIDKLKYLSLQQQDLIDGDNYAPQITVNINKKAKTITISDNGIGMDREDLINNIGTIASSGTAKFTAAMENKEQNADLIGQFGVGFYSAFIVAKNVTVKSKKAGQEQVWQWQSDGDGKYQLCQLKDKRSQGTEIILLIKDEHLGYLDFFRLEHIIKTYSNHITTPILLNGKDGKDELEQVNAATALWTRQKSELKSEDYTNFYRQVGYAADEPWLTMHNKNEGVDLVYTNLLFIPTNKPFDLFHPDRKPRIKLYVKKVFITEDQVQLIPAYLRFMRGIIDAENLPLNISRETLQHNVVIEKIKKNIAKKIINELHKKAGNDEADYLKFWGNFGAVLKEGLCEHMVADERDKLLKVCRFASTKADQLTSIDDYIARMPAEQKEIYYLVGNTIDQAASNPRLEGFKAKGYEVLLLSDHVDDFWLNVVTEYQDLKLKSVTRAEVDLADAEANAKAKDDTTKDVTNNVDNNIILDFAKLTLKSQVKDVIASNKLTSSPACLAVGEGGMDIRMERFLRDQNQLTSSTLKLLELNMGHPLVKKIGDALALDTDAGRQQGTDLVTLLFEQACIVEGEPLNNPSEFAARVNKLLLAAA